MAGPFAFQLEKKDPLRGPRAGSPRGVRGNHTKQHEKVNITKQYFGSVSRDLVDRPWFSSISIQLKTIPFS
jgi:hypothetical protein